MNHFFKTVFLISFLFSLSFSYSIAQTNELNLDSLNQAVEKMDWKELDSIGEVSQEEGKYAEAEFYMKTALQVAKKEYGENDTLYARANMRLGAMYAHQRSFEKAKPYFIQARSIIERKQGKNYLYTETTSNLAVVYMLQGNFDEAEILYKEALELFLKYDGKNSKNYAITSCNLAAVYQYMESYEKAEKLYAEGLDILENITGKNTFEYAQFANNLAEIYYRQGLYKKAKMYLLDVLMVFENIIGKEHPYYALVSNSLAEIYLTTKQYDKAEQLYNEVKIIQEKTIGKEHIDYALNSASLGKLYFIQKKYDKAEISLKESLEIINKISTKTNPLYIPTSILLSNLYSELGKYDKAEEILLEVKGINEKFFNKNYISYTITLNDLGTLYANQNQYDKAVPYFKESIKNLKESINLNLPILSEEEKQQYLNSRNLYFSNFLDFAFNYYSINKKVSIDVFNQQLFKKGLVFSSTQKIRNQILNSGDTLLIAEFENWKTKKEDYIKLIQIDVSQTSISDSSLKVMEFEINELEKNLSKKSRLFNKNINQKEHTWQQVKDKLAKDEAVVELIRQVSVNSQNELIDTIYAALIVTQNTKEQPELIIFQNGSNLEKGAMSFYQNNIEFQLEDNESYNQYWKPIDSILQKLSSKGYSKIYFSPDGIYHKLNLNVLQNPKTGKFLIDEQTIQLIASSRDLIEKDTKSVDLSKNFASYQSYLMGYPKYDESDTENSTDTTQIKGDNNRSFSGLQRIAGTRGKISILEGTKIETQSINQIFNKKGISSILAMNENASEENIKALKSPTILHIATHGFFISPPKENEIKTMEDAQNRNLLKNPFMRSGLLLAGCQNPPAEGEEDGILSAEEAMNLDLEGTELVVLSACETGLGDVENGEGVYGLQRAFQQAGAKTIVMSLWKVSDEATQLLMTEFYQNLLNGKSKREAFKNAQLTLRKKYPEPFYWGAFVMVGE